MQGILELKIKFKNKKREEIKNRRKEEKAKPLWRRVNLKKKKKRSSTVEQEVSLEFKERKPSSFINP